MIPTLVALSIFIFVLTQLPPGSYLDSIVTELESQGESISQDQIESLEERYGFNEPLHVQYFKWVSGWVHGDFGTSFTYYGQQNLDDCLPFPRIHHPGGFQHTAFHFGRWYRYWHLFGDASIYTSVIILRHSLALSVYRFLTSCWRLF